MTALAYERHLPRLAAVLRGAGVRIGTGSVVLAAEALAAIDATRRDDVRDALCAALVHEPQDRALFEQLFELAFPRRYTLAPGSELALPRDPTTTRAPGSRRLAEALPGARGRAELAPKPERQVDASGTASARELLQAKDFEQMNNAELRDAQRLIDAAVPRIQLRRTRRFEPAAGGRQLDLRRMLRAAAHSPDLLVPFARAPRLRPRDWVVLIDVSGSMALYARTFLRFVHALVRRAGTVESFAFATRLTPLTRALRLLDPDAALAATTAAVVDWDSGTRIAECLAEFNRRWSRRVLTRGANVLLFSDGLETGDVGALEREVARLRRSARELIWVNPLLRSASYQPLAAGAAVLQRHATLRVSAHNVDTLLALARAIDGSGVRR